METSLPDGLRERHRTSRGFLSGRPNPLPLAVLLGIAVLGLTGVLGGGKPTTLSAEGSGVRLSAGLPATVRSGEYFEGRIEITADRPIADLTIGASRDLLDGFTLNSMFPEPEREAFEEGRFQFSFGDLAPGSSLVVQVDLQTNPSTVTPRSGVLTVHDGATELVRLPVHLRVLP